MRGDITTRFWARVSKSRGCWLWTACRNGNGYGSLYDHAARRMQLASRVSWRIHFGPIPSGLCVLHRCDNPPCVRPDHLFLGTQRDNMRDCAAKGRTGVARGEDNHATPLTRRDVVAIRNAYAAGRTSQTALGKRYGISQPSISSIILRHTWTHVP